MTYIPDEDEIRERLRQIRAKRGSPERLAELEALQQEKDRAVRRKKAAASGRKSPENSSSMFGHPWPVWFQMRDTAMEVIAEATAKGDLVHYGELWDEMEHRLAVGAQDHEVGIGFFAVGEVAADFAFDEVVDDGGLALHLELDGAFVLIGEAAGQKPFDAALIIFLPLRLEIRAAIALARAGGIAGERAFVPVEAEPAQAVEDDVHGFLRIARGIGVLNAQNEGAAGVPGVKPVEQSRARTADVQVAGG